MRRRDTFWKKPTVSLLAEIFFGKRKGRRDQQVEEKGNGPGT